MKVLTLRPVPGRTDFSRIFVFWPPDFVAGFILLIFVGKVPRKILQEKIPFILLIFVGKVPRKILQENPRQKPPKFIQQKIPDTFLHSVWDKNRVMSFFVSKLERC